MSISAFTAKNERLKKCIKISFSTDEEEFDALAVIYKRFTDEEYNWKKVASYEIDAGETAEETYYDVATQAGIEYIYKITVYDADSEEVMFEETASAVECEFNGFIIADSTGSFASDFGSSNHGYEVSHTKNMDIQYVKTLNGKYPHAVMNSESDYYTGTATALFLPSDANDCPIYTNINGYRSALLDFLCNHRVKLMKFDDGKIMKVTIDGTPNENYDALRNLITVTFNWTQIGDIEHKVSSYSSISWDGEA